MAKPARRGLPSDFSLDLPDDAPVQIGDFLDEPPPFPAVRKSEKFVSASEIPQPEQVIRPEVMPARREEKRPSPAPTSKPSKAPSVIRCQLNLTPKAKRMLEEVVEHVRTYSPETDARTSEVFQGIIGLVHSAMGELELADLPRRGAWGSVTAKNFPGALSETFEMAILRAAGKRAA
jgi:hypothetical protein